MNRMLISGAGSVTILLAASTLPAQARTERPATTLVAARAAAQRDSTAVAAVIERYHAALMRGDSATAMGLLAPDAIILESGSVETRAEYQSHHLGGDIAYAKATKSTRGAVRVAVSGDVAWTSSTGTTKGEYRGRQINSLGAELMVLTRTASGWKISAIHWSSRSQRPPG